MTIRLPHWLAGLLARFKPVRPHPPAAFLIPTASEAELQRLRVRVNELERLNKHLVESARRIDILAARAGENAKAMAAKFRLVKSNYVNFKLNTAQFLRYLEQPKVFKALPAFAQEDVARAADILNGDGAVDPNLSTTDIAMIREGKFKVRELKPLLEFGPDYESEGADIIKAMLAGPEPVAHNPATLTTEPAHERTEKETEIESKKQPGGCIEYRQYSNYLPEDEA